MEELRWGNRYFLNMQEPAGYVMNHVGGDALRHGDGNRWTDNVIGPEGGEPNTIDPTPGGSRSKITIVGRKDDRVIQTKPLDRLGQYKFVIAEAMTARVTKQSDRPYSDKCLEAAQRCYDWCATRWPEQTAETLGGALAAAVELYRCTGQEKYKSEAIACAARLAQLQVTEPLDAKDPVRGFYRRTAAQSRAVSRHLQRLLAPVRAVRPRGAVPRSRRGGQLAQGHSAVHRGLPGGHVETQQLRHRPLRLLRAEPIPAATARSATTGIAISCSRAATGGWASTRTSPRRGSGWSGPRRS